MTKTIATHYARADKGRTAACRSTSLTSVSLNLTDVRIGWVFTRTVRNNAHTHILGALKTAVHEIPYEVTGLDFDNGSEFLTKAVIKWAGEMEIFFTPQTAQTFCSTFNAS